MFSREELNYDEFILWGDIGISDDESEFNKELFFL